MSTAPHAGDGAGGIDVEYLRNSLRQIKQAQAEQSRIESERTGASRTAGRLVAVFGSLITAAAIGGFAWVWNANADNRRQEVQIETLQSNPPPTHGHAVIDRDARAIELRIVAIESSYAAITSRLDRIERENTARHTELIEELRRSRAAGSRAPTWGGR